MKKEKAVFRRSADLSPWQFILATIVIRVVIGNKDIINQAIMSLDKKIFMLLFCQSLIYLVAFHYFSHSGQDSTAVGEVVLCYQNLRNPLRVASYILALVF